MATGATAESDNRKEEEKKRVKVYLDISLLMEGLQLINYKAGTVLKTSATSCIPCA
jgi:hypothetical protein